MEKRKSVVHQDDEVIIDDEDEHKDESRDDSKDSSS